MGEQNKLTAEEMQHRDTHRDIMIDLHRQEMKHDGGVLSFRKGFDEGYLLAVRDKNQALADHVKATAAIREELERWKDKYEVSVEAGKVTNTELEAVKTELQYKSENLTEALRQIEHYENRLEVVKQEWDTFGQNVEMFRQEVKKRTDFADWVTRQRDELQKKLNELMNDKKDIHKTEK